MRYVFEKQHENKEMMDNNKKLYKKTNDDNNKSNVIVLSNRYDNETSIKLKKKTNDVLKQLPIA